MPYSDEILKDTALTEEDMLRDLEDIRSYYEAMEMEARLVPASQDHPMPTLVGALPEDDAGRARVAVHSFLPLDTESAEFTKYLQFYAELPDPLDKLDRLVLLEAVNRLNLHMPLGTCSVLAPRPEAGLPEMAALRVVQGFPLGQPIDQGVFTEDLVLFELSCTVTSMVLAELSAGKSMDEAFAAIGR